jgi:hypothetical protein
MGTFYGNQIMRTREAAHRVLIEPSLGDPCTALCVIDRVPKPRARVSWREFKCIGAKPPQDHPHICRNMGDASEIVCP